MDDMKDKMKGFMKKVNNLTSSSSSGKFKGQGRVLGSSSSAGPNNPNLARPNPNPNPKPKPTPPNPSSSSSNRNNSSLPRKPLASDENKSGSVNVQGSNPKPVNGFDPYDSLITTGKRSQNGYSLNVFECPICGQSFRTEDEVSQHVESCVNSSNNENSIDNNDANVVGALADESRTKIEVCVGGFLSGSPNEASVEVVRTLLRNVVREPENGKFRRIRMSNLRIREAIGEVVGGVELLEVIGFELRDEGGEMWAVMEVPDEKRIGLLTKVIELLGPRKVEEPPKVESSNEAPAVNGERVEPEKFDRQVKVFFAVPENVAARIQLPDSFYNLSIAELKREAESRKKKIDESQLLIPKSYREKQAQAAKKRHTKTMIRIQFPDQVVLQAVFRPWEQTTALYEFVSNSLKDPSLQFELVHPISVRRRVIPHFAAEGKKPTTLEDEELVPSALIKFKPIETDSVVFTGLCNELLEIIEPLV
ncbi:hypothetical protein LWI29_036718 [Acer saccharum]|uniref:UBX domain-containing protein n=1 Tax=Acer saccharum TaxID=4024 RepID=A0AA39RJA4_ACESA|nr:hypothetical protein LWI29_004522 [Acer saccharum]KAK0575288.1 hypothetical protein LWI29_036718 [Acer saccharum]KAK1552838.1 hypothetical protein Q3G72_024181 [Acer saccharum]